MKVEDRFRTMVGAYLGIRELDEYPLKEYVLYDLEIYIKNFILEHSLNLDYPEVVLTLEKELSLKSKLQDLLLVLPKINASMELIFLVKAKIRELQESESY